ncbi:alkaline phosphatase family protein [Conexibacter woesei]|uniref:Type I phosphodiesterase/nucleotide pyrophosphatase n=1 Tax=Conexibacter woesei (strain DSM 14684 / CCUG 47730 / CIP 108061 / JCM 11494 / NBRC 100937 / ID131577) TaxID=469383 RepID=D3F3W3_CONWI|nr:alkaline phosphatase family protein [Conexibacter woesei]ADB54338.1 type I phosphodiesterase/nucleotide pyrophosphatase [Conexibacter woesei DSM 14684]
MPPKLVLTVLDGMKPAMLERAIALGRAPTLKAIQERGAYVDDCVAAFPSVTPVCAASIATGTSPDRHRIPSMNWFSREEERYVEYGSSFSASRKFGVLRSLTDTVYNMNAKHLAADTPTVFELLDDADVRTAGTTYLMYRGRHEHHVTTDTPLARIANATVFREPVNGPRELFYADLFASRRTGCRGQFGMPGARDAHTGCVGSYLVEHDLFDFLLFSLPDNDTWSHRNGPHAQVTSIAAADRQLERLVHAGGGLDRFLEEHAMIVMADHSHTHVEQKIRLDTAFADWAIARPNGAGATDGEIAISPAQRSAMIYVLPEERRSQRAADAAALALALPGVDLAMRRAAPREGVIASERGELHFAPGGDLVDLRGRRWSVDGELETLGGRIEDGRLLTPDYPDALGRVWSALTCPTAGDVLLSAGPAYEFVDWGGAAHIGGGSHGSLHRSDSLGALLWCGTGPANRDAHEQWTLRDVLPIVTEHFGLPTPAAG